MTDRGQDDFVRLPGFAARLYGSLTRGRSIQQQHGEIASYLASRIERGRVLDVGTGPGYLLIELHWGNPSLELFGLDISHAMVKLAQKNVSGLGIDVRLGTIQNAPFDDDFFDLVTCTGSFYLWDQPQAGLDEMFRILKPRRSAFLFETYRDCDRASVLKTVDRNLRGEGLFRRVIAPRLFLKQLRMTYDTSEIPRRPAQAVQDHRLGAQRAQLPGPGRAPRARGDLVPPGGQPGQQVLPDHPGSPGDEDPH